MTQTNHRTNKVGLVLLVLAILQGCTAMDRPRPMPDDPAFAPVRPSALMQRDASTGSIFQTSRNFNIYGDTKALNVGDVLLVNLQESTRASKSSQSSISKESEITMRDGSLLGRTLNLGTGVGMDRDFSGQADAGQRNSMVGSITVSVIDVLPNGVLLVRGEKWLSLTNGDEYIRLTGMVRPEDIRPDNSVSSNRIADARISYGGTGDFDQANQMGWLSRFFNSEWWPL
ncbi:MAG: flagellar basal body L-ring protein FlgH [Marinobacter sp.]|nr:flagellar basal body L-ring protein FlgH [Marinobacter sp.]